MNWLYIKILAVIIVVGLFSFAIFTKNQSSNINQLKNNGGVGDKGEVFVGKNNLFADSDGDGLKNWEETLWKTDLNNSDSDGDGTLDGVEVEAGRNPLKPPPDNLDSEKKVELGAVTSPEEKQDSFTDGSGVKTPSKTESKIAANPLKDYGNQLGFVIKEHLKYNRDETPIFKAIIATSSPQNFDRLAKLSLKYKTLSQNILLIKAPSIALDLNTSLGNDYKERAAAIAALVSYKNASIIPYSAFQDYNKTVLKAGSDLITTIKMFTTAGITFGPLEDGAIFNFPSL